MSEESKNESIVTTDSEETARENIDFKVVYNKRKIDVSFDLDGTVADLKTHLQSIISVPAAMQKVMIKGLAKDKQTLRSLGVTNGNIQDPFDRWHNFILHLFHIFHYYSGEFVENKTLKFL